MKVIQLDESYSSVLYKFLMVEHIAKLAILQDIGIKAYFLTPNDIGACIAAINEDDSIKSAMLTSLEGSVVTRNIHGPLGQHTIGMLDVLANLIKARPWLNLTKIAFLISEGKADKLKTCLVRSSFGKLAFTQAFLPALKIPEDKDIWDTIVGKNVPQENLICLQAAL